MPSSSTRRLAELTWTDVERALADGTRTAVLAVGAVEQHGPHLPLAVDALTGDELAVRVAERLGDALAAPTVRPGCSDHHMAFPGTVTVPEGTLQNLVRAHCRSLDAHGFDCVALLPTHGGNFDPVAAVAPEVDESLDAQVVALTDLEWYMALQRQGLRAAGVDYRQEVVHAGAVETATTLAIAPDLVREDRLEPGHEGPVPTERLLAEGFDAVTENGVFGDPREATAAAGEAVLETVADAYAERIDAARDDSPGGD